jgi:hypothetical protein
MEEKEYHAYACYTTFDGENHKLSLFCDHLSKAIHSFTGEEFNIHKNIDSIKWGGMPQIEIEKVLTEVSFFIPIITPTFLKDEGCCKALQRFSDAACNTQREDLILPIIYIQCERDDLDKIIRSLNYKDVSKDGLFLENSYETSRAREIFADMATSIKERLASMEKEKHSPRTRKKHPTHTNVSSPITIPLVVAAMNSTEAQELFNNPGERRPNDSFHEKFKRELDQHKISTQELLLHYKDKRDKWIPNLYQAQCIENTITEVCNAINKSVTDLKRENPNLDIPFIRIQSFSEEFFSKDREKWSNTIKALKRNRYFILVLDPVSLFHYNIIRKLNQSDLVSSDEVAVVTLSPIASHLIQANKLIEEQIEKHMELYLSRQQEVLDELFEDGISDVYSLKRRLRSIMQTVAYKGKGVHPNNHDIFPNEPTGIGKIVLSGGIEG